MGGINLRSAAAYPQSALRVDLGLIDFASRPKLYANSISQQRKNLFIRDHTP